MAKREPIPLTSDLQAQLEGREVKVYRNLNIKSNKLWSVQFEGLVVCHIPTVQLLGVRFTVSEPSRQRVLATCRNVHAYAIGIFTSQEVPSAIEPIKYDPYFAGYFFRVADPKKPIYSAAAVRLHRGETFASPEPFGLGF
jgi:hypothetical protein